MEEPRGHEVGRPPAELPGELGGRRAVRKRRGQGRRHGTGRQPHSPVRDAHRSSPEPRAAPAGRRRVELRLMRVAEDMWRQRIGTRLAEVAIDWCRHHGVRTLVLNTTTPQNPPSPCITSSVSTEAARTFHRQIRAGVVAARAVMLDRHPARCPTLRVS